MFRHAFKALRAHPTRSLLMLASLAVAVAAVFLITAIARGIIDSYGTILRSDGDIIVTQARIADTFFSDVDTALMGQISALPGVAGVSALIVGASPVGALPIAAIYGVSANRMEHYRLVQGSYPKAGEVIVGAGIADRLGGSSVSIGDRRFRVSGVFTSKTGFENGGVVMNLADASKLFHKKASMLFVQAKDLRSVKELTRWIAALSPKIEVKTGNDFIAQYHQFTIIRRSADLIALIALLMGLISIASLMSVTMLERKYEFGILRALGTSRTKITARILSESLLLALAAYAVALVVSWGVLEILGRLPTLQGYVQGRITPDLAMGVFVAAVGMTLLGALIPAWRASGIDPMTLMLRGSRA